MTLTTRTTFRVVGIELGANERLATETHVTPRLKAALQSGQRLVGLAVPAAGAAQMWRTTILAKALYGCEVRNITHRDLRPLCLQGKQVIGNKAPLANSNLAATEVVCGPPLGACAVRD